MAVMTGTPAELWRDAPLVAVDLEGSGAQDRDHEAILEIALVPIIDGQPSLTSAYTTLINPERRITRGRWISPGLTDQVLADAPVLADVAPELTARLDGKVIVGHNVGVDWRLLHRRCPGIQPGTLIDTLKLARHLHTGAGSNSLTTLLDRHQLTDTVTRLAPGSRPHRALWDTIGAALLLNALIQELPNAGTITLTDLRAVAEQPSDGNHKNAAPSGPHAEQTSLLDI